MMKAAPSVSILWGIWQSMAFFFQGEEIKQNI